MHRKLPADLFTYKVDGSFKASDLKARAMRGRAESLTWRHGWQCRGRLPGAGWRPGTMGRQCPPFPSKTAPGSDSAAAFQLAWWDEHQLWGRHIMCQSYCAMLDISMHTYVEIVLFLSLSLSSVYLECLFIWVGKKHIQVTKHSGIYKNIVEGNKTRSSKEDTQPTNVKERHQWSGEQAANHLGKHSESHRTVSWHNTLSSRVTSLTESSLGGKGSQSRQIKPHPHPCPWRSGSEYDPEVLYQKSAWGCRGGGGTACRGARRQPSPCTVNTNNSRVWTRDLTHINKLL